MDPSVDGDVIDLDATLGQEFFNVAVGESVSEVPADGEHDHFGWESVAGERCAIDGCWLLPSMVHLFSLAG